jgi:eukaryotic-like serine/threonine-protein kinase
MGPRTPCPHPIRLRLFLRDQADARGADRVREHLAQCESCRSLVAGLESGAEEEIQHTLIDEGPAQSGEVGFFHDPREDVRLNDDGPVITTIQIAVDSPKGPADRVSGSPVSNATNEASRAITSDSMSTCLVPPGADDDTGSFVLPNGTTPGDPGPDCRIKSDSISTCEIPPGADAETGSFVLPGASDAKTEESALETAAGSSGANQSDFRLSPTLRDSKLESVSSQGRFDNVSIPGYDILEELGRGGMGVVYKARDRRLQRLVALKMVLAGAHVGAAGLQRFRAEAEAVAKLSHANIVQIYETGEHEGRPYFSLELVEGGSLDQRMAGNPTSPRGAAAFIETLARTMAVAHERGIVHRDLKPANILLAKLDSQSSIVKSRAADSQSLPADHWSRSTIPKIADFGLAKQVDDDSSQTKSGTIMGTPSYMAPEQAGGKNREIGPAADIYSLGAILYEMLVGRPPFKAGNPIDTIRQVIDQDPVPPRQLEPRVPHDLETICLKCLEKQPSHRFATATELADDLRRFVEGDPIHARPTPAWERAWKWAKRRKEVAALLAVSTLAAIAMVLLIVWHNITLRSELGVALSEERQARQREQEAREEQRLALLQQEAQKLFDSARLAVAAADWPRARVDLEKTLTTVGGNARLSSLEEPALALLKRVEDELRVESDRRASRARLQSFVALRDEAQFLGTLYTGMDLTANLEAARASVVKALEVYGVVPGTEARPSFDSDLTDAQKSEILADCSQLLLILAETEAQSRSPEKPLQNEQLLRRALTYVDQARRLGAAPRAFHLRRARYLNLLGDSSGAARAEKAARAAALDDVFDFFLMADELYRREQFAEAIKEFDRVLERKPGHFWAQYLNALCLLRQKRPAEARALLSACLAQRSDFVWLYLLRGFAHQELEAWAAADSDFERASKMALDENARYVLFVNRGVLRVRTDRIADAVADLKAAIALKPTAYQAYVNLAQAFRKQGRLDLALAELNRAIKLEPGLAHLHRLEARLLLERDEPDLALASLDRAIEREHANSPFQVDDYIERGRLLLRSEKFDQALASFDAALALRGDHPLAQRLRAEALFRLGRFEAVIKAFDAYLETGKPLESVYRGRGLARSELGQYPGAIDDFTKALELHPTSAVQANRGWTYLVVDSPKLALRDFELAIELDPKNSDAYNGRSFARAKLGRHREAVLDVAEALRLGPPSARLFYNAARTLAQCPSPQPRRAVDLIRQALSALPAAGRRDFWTAHIQKDAALAVLRSQPSFTRLEYELTGAK